MPIKIDLAAGTGNAPCEAHEAQRKQARLGSGRQAHEAGRWSVVCGNAEKEEKMKIVEKAALLVEKERAKTQHKEVIIFGKIHRFPGDMKRNDLFKAVRELLGDKIGPSWLVRIYDPKTDKNVQLETWTELTTPKNMLYTVEVPVPWHVEGFLNENEKMQFSNLPSTEEDKSPHGSDDDDWLVLDVMAEPDIDSPNKRVKKGYKRLANKPIPKDALKK